MPLSLPASAKPLTEVRFLESGIWEPHLTNIWRSHFHERDGYRLHYSAESQLIYVEKGDKHRAVHATRTDFFSFKVPTAADVVPIKAVK